MFWCKHKYTDLLIGWAGYCTIAYAFFIPLSKTGTTISLLLMASFLLFSGDWKANLRSLWQIPITRIALLLLLLFSIGLFYTPIDFAMAAESLLRNKVFVFAILFVVFTRLPSTFHHRCIASFLLGCMLLVLMSLLNAAQLVSFDTKYSYNVYPFLNHIFASFILVFAMYVLAEWLWVEKGKNLLLWLMLITIGGTVLFISFSRTGYLLALCMLIIFFLQKLSIKKLLPLLLIGMMAFTTIFLISPRLQQGLTTAYNEVVHYEQGEPFITSVGSRLEMLRVSFLLWKEKPWFGHGTQSFLTESVRIAKLDAEQHPELLSLLGTPHNEYAHIAVQLGGVGFLVFISWLIVQFYEARKLPPYYASLAQGLTVLFAVGCFSESMLSMSIPGKFYVFFLALLFSQSRARKAMFDQPHGYQR